MITAWPQTLPPAGAMADTLVVSLNGWCKHRKNSEPLLLLRLQMASSCRVIFPVATIHGNLTA
jgi:hypothetical protein